ncbi:hypothetical protein [Streptomyces sp. NBC_01171]|uniref:hypothetical protein n=1 Tax=Streptomyces sp. NBC_01171 TaxID=2903757 RepID=UPI00386D5CD9
MTLAHQAAPPLQPAADPLDAQSLPTTFGTLGTAAVMFAETGLLIGFFLVSLVPVGLELVWSRRPHGANGGA